MSDPLDTLPGQLDTIAAQFAAGANRMERIEEWQALADRRMYRIEQELHNNTEMTRQLSKGQADNSELLKDIKDAVTAGRVMGRLSKYVGGLAAAGVSVWGAVEFFFKHKG